ncbi:MAG: hypothetical protein AAGJ93_12730 [Bacteroidota bacterium]
MIRYVLLVVMTVASFPALSQKTEKVVPNGIDPLTTELKFENSLPDKEIIVNTDAYTALSSSTLLFQPQQRMDFSYVKYAINWPSMKVPEGSAPDSYRRSSFTFNGNQGISGFTMYSVMNVDLKSIARGESVFRSHSYASTSRNDVGGQFFDFKNKKLFFLTPLQAQ